MNPLTMMKLKSELANIVMTRGQPEHRRESMKTMFAVLVEEVGEVATVLQHEPETNFDDLLVEELAQVAAVSVTMIDMIYARSRNATKGE